jgi:hypothetical protein
LPDLATELEHLRRADTHIALARENVARLEALDAGRRGDDRGSALATARRALAEFEGVRAVILSTIAGIRDGSLPTKALSD